MIVALSSLLVAAIKLVPSADTLTPKYEKHLPEVADLGSVECLRIWGDR